MGKQSVLETRAAWAMLDVGTAWAVAVRPRLWPTAVRQGARLARDRWWARPPFLPLPSSSYLRFRLETQYGDAHQCPEPDDVVRYLQWCRTWAAADRAGRPASRSQSYSARRTKSRSASDLAA